jgi:hypothetical protein
MFTFDGSTFAANAAFAAESLQEYLLRAFVYQPRRMLAMSGILRQLLCLSVLGLMVGSLWLFAASATVPSIPPWNEKDQMKLHGAGRVQIARPGQAVAAAPSSARDSSCGHFDPDLDYDVDDITTTAAFQEDDCDYSRRPA